MLPNLKVGLQILTVSVAGSEADFDVPAIGHDREKTDELAYSVQLNGKQLTELASAMPLKLFVDEVPRSFNSD